MLLIITKVVKRVWNRNLSYKKKWIKMGYGPFTIETVFDVKVKDLPKNAKDLVLVRCDYCWSNEEEKEYRVYKNNIDRSLSKTYACSNCLTKKQRKESELKFDQGLLEKGDPGYWSIRKNRLKELKMWLDQNAGKKSFFQSSIYNILRHYGDECWETIKEVGYTEEGVRLTHPDRWWFDFENNVKPKILNFLEKYNRFPKQKEFSNSIKIPSEAYMYHEGITGMKAKMGYQDEDAILDVKGKQHKSLYEAVVANFLIAQKVAFTKEQMPFPEDPYRSDFYLHNIEIGEKKVHVELWGYKDDDQGLNKQYNIKRKIKEELYDIHSRRVLLIPLEPEFFQSKSYKQMAQNLYNVFSEYITLPYKEVDVEDLIPKGKQFLTAEKLLELCMDLSKEPNTLPSTEVLVKERYTVYKEIIRRYERLEHFASSFNDKKIKVVRVYGGYWNYQRLLNTLEDMYQKEGYLLNSKEARKTEYRNLIDASYRNGNPGWGVCQLLFYKTKLEEGKKLTSVDQENANKIVSRIKSEEGLAVIDELRKKGLIYKK